MASARQVRRAEPAPLGSGCSQDDEQPRGHTTFPFTPGRTDTSQERTDVNSFAVLEPLVDGFRNFQEARYPVPAETLLVDMAA
ncbi:MAG: catalase-peroxidase, partial [Polyangiaceae bacterium]